MPVGYPKDPVAHAAKLAAEREAKVATSAKPVKKRTYKKRASSHTVSKTAFVPFKNPTTTLTKSVGMAIMITEKNRDKIAIVNDGVEIEADDTHKQRDYYFFPYDYNAHSCILTEEKFFDKYRFANTQDENYFVEVDQL